MAALVILAVLILASVLAPFLGADSRPADGRGPWTAANAKNDALAGYVNHRG